jgi:hypothetical protein
MIIARDPAILSSMLSNACTVLPDINTISGALTTPATFCASAQCRMYMRDGQGHHRAGYLCARNALHVHGMRTMKDVVILETALIKWC